jgi:starvation-inducible DNA-binding protein
MAQRIRTLGGPAIGTLAEFMPYTWLKEHPGHYPGAQHLLATLQGDHEPLSRQLRGEAEMCAEELHKMGSHGLLVGIMRQHQEIAWMLRSVIEGMSA